MSDTDTSTTDAAAEDVQAATSDDTPADDSLGDPGKKALAAEREARKKAERDVKDLRARFEQMEEAQNKTAAERAELDKQRQMERDALAKANERIVSAEIRAAAKGELADPGDALTFIDRSDFDVGDDGSVDADAIKSAVADLLNQKPYLAARRDARVEGSADAGAREATRLKQWTRDDVRKATPEQVEDARVNGLLRDVMEGKS